MHPFTFEDLATERQRALRDEAARVDLIRAIRAAQQARPAGARPRQALAGRVWAYLLAIGLALRSLDGGPGQ